MLDRFISTAFRAGQSFWFRPVMRITAVALAGWAAIVALAWELAYKRIDLCESTACEVRATAARDYVLTAGLSVALAILIASLTIHALTTRGGGHSVHASSRRPATYAARQLPQIAAREISTASEGQRQSRLPLVLAAAFGMALGSALLWSVGMLRLDQSPQWALAPIQGVPFAPSSAPGVAVPDATGAYDDLIPQQSDAKNHEDLIPTSQRRLTDTGATLVDDDDADSSSIETDDNAVDD